MPSIPFDPENLFPLYKENDFPYDEEKLHAELVDDALGFELEFTEKEIFLSNREDPVRLAGHQTWNGFSPQTFQTPYTEIRRMLEVLHPNEGATIIDLGCAYGRMAFVIGRHYPGVHYMGYEIVEERVGEGERCLEKFHFKNVQLIHENISSVDFSLPVADFYFMYDFGLRGEIAEILSKLKVIAGEHKITVVGRGRATRDAIEREHPWLSEVVKPQHCGNFSIYRSRE